MSGYFWSNDEEWAKVEPDYPFFTKILRRPKYLRSFKIDGYVELDWKEKDSGKNGKSGRENTASYG